MSFQASRALFLGTVPKNGFAKNWLMDAGTYPVLTVIAAAAVLLGWQGNRMLRQNPDIVFAKDKRAQQIHDNDNESYEHYNSGFRNFGKANSPEMMPNLNASMTAKKMAEKL